MARHTLKAVHDDDLPALLRVLGVLRAFERGELQCKFCDSVITRESLHAVFPEGGAVKAVCHDAACVAALLSYRRDRTA
jgi:hypothetical protein